MAYFYKFCRIKHDRLEYGLLGGKRLCVSGHVNLSLLVKYHKDCRLGYELAESHMFLYNGLIYCDRSSRCLYLRSSRFVESHVDDACISSPVGKKVFVSTRPLAIQAHWESFCKVQSRIFDSIRLPIGCRDPPKLPSQVVTAPLDASGKCSSTPVALESVARRGRLSSSVHDCTVVQIPLCFRTAMVTMIATMAA